jgi:hypothetical protein
MNLIGIDPSLVSTAVCVNGKLFNYCREKDALGKKGMFKWYKLADELVNYRYIEYQNYKNYMNGEIIKLVDYDKVTDQIISDIKENIDTSLKTLVGIEGFSYSSSAGDIIDLVTFSTLLRKKIYDQITTDILVVSPSTLKLESCKLTYPPIDVGKRKPKLKWMNNEGIAGGHFTKREMFLTIVENDNLNDDWSRHCKIVKGDLLEGKKIPKPYEDLNDAALLFLFLKENRRNG